MGWILYGVNFVWVGLKFKGLMTKTTEEFIENCAYKESLLAEIGLLLKKPYLEPTEPVVAKPGKVVGLKFNHSYVGVTVQAGLVCINVIFIIDLSKTKTYVTMKVFDKLKGRKKVKIEGIKHEVVFDRRYSTVNILGSDFVTKKCDFHFESCNIVLDFK